MPSDVCFFTFRFVPRVFSDSTEQLTKTPSFARRLQAKSDIAVFTGLREFEFIQQGKLRTILAGAGDANLIARDAQCFLEFLGEKLDFFEDFLRLLGQVVDHAVDHLRFAANQFQRGDHQCEMIVDVVPQVRKFPVQVSNLFRTERHGLSGQTHAPTMGWPAVESKLV